MQQNYRDLVRSELGRWQAYSARDEGLADYDALRSSPSSIATDALYRRYIEGRDVLEIGCGAGHLLASLARDEVPRNYYGTDLSAGMLKAAQRRGVTRVAAADGHALPLRSASFDTVLAGHSVFRYLDPPVVLAEVRRVLRPGGMLMFDVWLFFRQALSLAADLARASPKRWGHTVRNARLHLNPFSGSYWENHLRKARFKIVRELGVLEMPYGRRGGAENTVVTAGWTRNLANCLFLQARRQDDPEEEARPTA